MSDPLRDEIAVIRAAFPELEEVKEQMDPGHWSFMIRSMAQAYRLGEQNAMIRITPKVGQA